jgi:PIN domain nuclease of toxin-antitoxin system
MMMRHRQRGQILILLAAWLFFGGGASSALVVYDGSTSDMKKAVKRVIKDEDRKDVILSYLSHWESTQKKLDKQVSAGRKELFKTMRRQDAQRSEMEPIVAMLDDTFSAMDRDFLDWRFRVKDISTSAEWAEIVARPE